MSIGAIMAMTEARRRRDKRGRYMEDDGGTYMNAYPEADNRGNEPQGRYYPGGMPPISPGMLAADHPGRSGDRNPDRRPYHHGEGVGGNQANYSGMEMRRGRDNQRRRNEGEEGPRMGGYGGFVWDRMEPGGPRSEDDEDEDDEEKESRRMQRPGYPWGEDNRRGNITSMHDYAQGKEHKQQGKRMIGFQQDEGQKEKGHPIMESDIQF